MSGVSKVHICWFLQQIWCVLVYIWLSGQKWTGLCTKSVYLCAYGLSAIVHVVHIVCACILFGPLVSKVCACVFSACIEQQCIFVYYSVHGVYLCT